MYYIGIDIGGTNTAVGILDRSFDVVLKKVRPSDRRDSAVNVKNILALIEEVLYESGIEIRDLAGVGVGVPGIWDDRRGAVLYCPNIALANVAIREEILKLVPVPVYINKDANCAALAESVKGAARDASISVTIMLGTGIGSGLIVNGEVYSGFNNAAVEFGHCVIQMDGKKCSCGRRGCWEAYGSATALIGQAYDAGLSAELGIKLTPQIVFGLEKEGNELAQKVVNRYVHFLCEGFSNVISVFQPEVLVVGGGIANQENYLLRKIEEAMCVHVYGNGYTRIAKIKVTELRDNAGIIGAALLAEQG